MTQQIAEIVTFSLVEGISPDTFLRLSQASGAFVRAHPGFVHRRLSRGTDGCWSDTVIWANMDAAQAAAAAFPKQDFAPALMGAIDTTNVTMRHETVLWSMRAD